METPRRALWARVPGLAWVLCLVALACAPKLGNALVWDDLPLIRDGDFIHDWRNLPRAFGVDTMFAADGGQFQAAATLDTWRPVSIATFFVDSAFSGRHPLAYHLDNLLAHLACVALVYAVARRLLAHPAAGAGVGAAPSGARADGPAAGRPDEPSAARGALVVPATAPLVAAAWFGLNPALGEAHLWINGRSDLWCTLFGLAGFALWLDARRAPARRRAVALYGAAGALWLLGLLSKETLLPALAVVAAWTLLRLPAVGVFAPAPRFRAAAAQCLPLAAAAALYLAGRAAVLSGLHTADGAEQLGLAVVRLPVLLLDGLRGALAPVAVLPRYLHEEYGRLGPAAPALAAVAVAGVAGFAWGARRRLAALSFGLCWFGATLAPASLIATLQWYGFGRYLYLPAALLGIGLAGAGAGVWRAWAGRLRPAVRRFCRAAGAVYLGLLAVELGVSARDWNGPEAFYRALIAQDPAASHGHGGLGKLLVEAGHPLDALQHLRRAVELALTDSRYLNNLGVAYLRAGKLDRALEVARLGADRFPHHDKFARLAALVREAQARPPRSAVTAGPATVSGAAPPVSAAGPPPPGAAPPVSGAAPPPAGAAPLPGVAPVPATAPAGTR